MYSYDPCMAFSGAGGAWRRVEGRLGTRGSGWVQNEPREARGRAERDSPFSDNTVSLRRTSLNWSSHTSLWHCLFFQALIPLLSLSYRPISLILPLSPSSPQHSVVPSILPTFPARALNCSPHQFTSSHPIFFLSHQAERLHYSRPKIVSFLPSLLFSPALWGDTCAPPATCSVLFPSANRLAVTINDVNMPQSQRPPPQQLDIDHNQR